MEGRHLLLAAALLAAALGTYVIVQQNRKRQVGTVTASKQVKSKKNVRLTLEKDHFEWLRDMAQKHNLPDDGKALRVLLSYAKNEGSDEVIFKKIRCIQCSKKDKTTKQFTIEQAHEAYLSTVTAAYKLPDVNKAVRILIDYASSEGDEDLIFEVKRCAHGATCQNC